MLQQSLFYYKAQLLRNNHPNLLSKPTQHAALTQHSRSTHAALTQHSCTSCALPHNTYFTVLTSTLSSLFLPSLLPYRHICRWLIIMAIKLNNKDTNLRQYPCFFKSLLISLFTLFLMIIYTSQYTSSRPIKLRDSI